ncbi:30S ribosomal protein S7 [candidate division WOR-1 bacterium RIFOXYD2_FULL_36_8]|uniref:Small ribosomal subunit protein uS7 n=1 Tax=candidate division WOR-1 bacterium RIFOXYB2_FULL_36_35 TaxID=1802578 RepID=A0A1F4S529_UNCSA|nr:MAG: 30S ribosomal protein S7 [candidate division WOR-1 bacterium RIFOXYA2_FULL_36_21]OGC15535.1 MAG: 30S ribosomal protein S7 [candidate division WOR-1 bacterium RIFOXYB2_FULL_36_35]OGC21320.1 MAG: 30S ribosomal protein S7 [candidate division WOR-1 bacterium RIFOXYA12_FULL_36_13]OGC37641.1 MAG: 30S ribosomal protein S7 [candidate division WOR-1 bacterium RIFOXYD2_FULL_36_8]
MPRSGKISKRKFVGDAVYGNVDIQRFINKVMYDGKKSLAEKLVYSSLKAVEDKLKKDGIEIFKTVLHNLSPLMEVKSRRVGGATYQVPIEVTSERGKALAMQWLRDAARERAGKGMVEKLTLELLDSFNGVGVAMKKKEDMHKTAESNKAFAHFRW